MGDLTEELRLIGCHSNGEARCTCGIGQDAADAITALRAEVERLTANLQSIVNARVCASELFTSDADEAASYAARAKAGLEGYDPRWSLAESRAWDAARAAIRAGEGEP